MTATLPLPEKPKLSYRYEFKPHEIDEIIRCNEDHGFAVVKGMISPDWVVDLKRDIQEKLDPRNEVPMGGTKVHVSFVEDSPALQRLLDYRPYMHLFESILGTTDLTLNRSAAILKRPGCEFGAWHTDWAPFNRQATTPDPFLNHGDWPAGFWFYLNGTHPARGGLALIEDSHRPD